MAEDTILGILPRVIASICGVYLVCYAVMESKAAGKAALVTSLIGRNSLEIYYIHCVMVRSLEPQRIEILSAVGIHTLAVGFAFITLTTLGLIQVIKRSKCLYGIIFGNKIKMGR